MPSSDSILMLSPTPAGNRYSKPIYFSGGWAQLEAEGTFSGGTVEVLQARHTRPTSELEDASNYRPLEVPTSLTADGSKSFRCGEAMLVLKLSGSAGSDSLEASIVTESLETRESIRFASTNAVT